MIARYTLPQMGRIWEDDNKFRRMLEVELLVCEALALEKIIPKKALIQIRKRAKVNPAKVLEIEKKTRHDIIAFVNQVSEHLGPYSRYFHYGLTSNDLNDTVLGLNLKSASKILIDDLKKLLRIVARKAKKYKHTICVGRTHGIHAEPVTFGLKLALFYDEIKRGLKNLEEAKDAVCCGKISGAVGAYTHLDPNIESYVCKKLNLKSASIATQVIPRDRHAQFLNTLAVIAASLERFSLEIRHLQRTEVQEALEPFTKTQKGSSAMPHKRNPILSERICGMARLLRVNAQAALENIALWHERDISHSSVERIIIPDSTTLLDYMLTKVSWMVDNLIVDKKRMDKNLEHSRGLIYSQRILLALMAKGLGRTQSYDIVQSCAKRVWQGNMDFKDALLESVQVKKYLSAKEIEKYFNKKYYIRNVDKIFKKVGLQ